MPTSVREVQRISTQRAHFLRYFHQRTPAAVECKMTTKGSFLIEDILSASKSSPPKGIYADIATTSSDAKSWPIRPETSVARPEQFIASFPTPSVDGGEESEKLTSVSEDATAYEQACISSSSQGTIISPAITIAVPLPLNSGQFPSYSYSSDHLKPLNLAAKARLGENDDPSILAPVVTIPKLPLNVPSYIPKLKGRLKQIEKTCCHYH